MTCYLLDNYHLSTTEKIYSCIFSAYGFRHLKCALKKNDLIHGIIGIAELIPFLGTLFSLLEKSFAGRVRLARFKIIKTGSQANCFGEVQESEAKKICQQLNSHSEKGAAFQEDLVRPFISGGTCSAMAFDFADRYLQKRTTLAPEEAIEALGADYQQSSPVFRTRQAAFNTICKNNEQSNSDFKQVKIAAMLRFHNRKIIEASSEFKLDNPNCLEKIREILKKFQQGTFVIRCLREENNPKEETYGHSTVLIRDGDKQYFYDPGEGISEIENGYETATLYQFLTNHNNSWFIPSARIYKII